MSTMITLKAALRALNKNKMRSGLTALGIIIGVGAVIAMVGIGNGAKAQVEAQVASLGQNVIQVSAGSTSSRGVRQGADTAVTLTIADAEAIAEEIPDVLAVSPEVKIKTQIVTGNRNWSASVYGESADYFTIRQWPVDSGTTFTEQDVRAAAKVAVLGATAAEELFGDQEPLGEIVRIQNAPFTVIGVLKSKGTSVSGSDNDDNVIVPYTIAMKRLVGQQTNLRRINVQAANADVLSEVETQITELLRQRHRTGSGDESDFKVQSQLEIGEVATQTTRTMTLLLAAIASVSLVVGGIGIMNIMLVSVTERTREIGVRMAVGARGGDILRQFLGEALTLSSLGGLIGIAVGTGTSKLIAATQDWPTLISLDSVLIAFFFSAAVGIFFGFYPARKASRLDPIDSLRYE
ncbi:MAG: multidrug ABC transporter substrate-binding protein [Verrucomicrobia bacterium]|nr:MAG: multidrug ABC transporter substrate-binding protein [Verrucomicrobiota bacterium]